MDVVYALLLIVVAFWLGACPFSVWIGRRFLGKDITEYGDHNPGATNVFRAGGRGFGLLAVFADVLKGTLPIVLAHYHFGLPEPAIYAMALSSVLGHMYSPFLGFHGGKATATTIGVLLAIPHPDVFVVFIMLMAVMFLFIEMDSDAWEVMLSGVGLLAYVVFSGKGLWMYLFVASLLIILGKRHFRGLCEAPHIRFKLADWLGSVRRWV